MRLNMPKKSVYVLVVGIAIFAGLEVLDRSGAIFKTMTWCGLSTPAPNGILEALTWTQDLEGGHALAAVQNFREAEEKYRSALRSIEEVHEPEHHLVISTINAVGIVSLMQGELAEARTLFERSLSLSHKVFTEDDPRHLTALGGLYQISYETGEYDAAEGYAKTRVKIREKGFDRQSPRLVEDLEALGSVYLEQRAYGDAAHVYERIVEIQEMSLDQTDPRLGESLGWLAFFYQATGRDREAEPLYLSALDIFGSAGPSDPATMNAVVGNYGELLRAAGREEEALALELRFRQGGTKP